VGYRPVPLARPSIGQEERTAVDRVLRGGLLAQGPEVAAFEAEFAAEVVDGRTCVAVSSGTAGLHLGLLAAGVGPGDEVIVPSFTFAATANAVALTGATPIFADIEPGSFGLDPEAVEAVVTTRTVGVMPVHLYGHPADLDGLHAVAARHGLAIFEDAAQAHAASYKGRPVGTTGAFAMFSLYATKNMTSGEGGMVSCDEDVAGRIRLLRNQGMDRRYDNEVIGFNARMSDLHAAIGRVQLTRLAGWTERRRRAAAYLDAELAGLDGLVVPPVAAYVGPVHHQYTVRILGAGERDRAAVRLREEHGVGTGVYYPVPTHRLPAYARSLDLPETERAAAEVLSLPVHPGLSEEDLAHVAASVRAVLGSS
jgi:dTDP-4-amino-4,6-dideoxygalactose transaminase